MSSPVKLVAPYPTMDEVAELYGISPTRLKQLKRMVQDLTSRGRNKTTAVRSRVSARNASRISYRGATAKSRTTKSSHNGHKKRAPDKK